MMSGVEWTIVTVIGVCLIVLFVALEVFFPIPNTHDQTIMDADDMADHQPVIRAAGSHRLH